MSGKTITLDTDLHSVLGNKAFDNFTVMQLRDEYIKIRDSNENIIKIRQFVYRQVLRFVRLGLLKKNVAANSREATYSKTKKFSNTLFKPSTFRKKITQASPEPTVIRDNLIAIQERLKQYQIDLLASVGESEEYMRLYRTNPEFKSFLEFEYLKARDKSSKLLGQIKAVKSVLTHYSN